MSNTEKGLALVTGASYGVGAAVAKALARDGWTVAITATRVENCAATAESIRAAGGACLVRALDLRAQDSIAALVDGLWREAPVRALVNNAAVNLRRDAVDVSRDEWDSVMLANLTGTFFLTQVVGKRLIEAGLDGSIVTVSSSHALVGAPQRSTYGISKAGLVQMTRMLAVEWGSYNIRLNALAPGRLETDSPSRAASGSDAAYMGKMLSKIPLGRFATGEDVAAMAAFLVGPGGSAITGQVIAIDGGLTAA